MPDAPTRMAFQVAVSDKEQSRLGIGGTAKTTERSIFFYAEGTGDGEMSIQALNANFIPAGEKVPITQDAFIERYRPEPLVYYNKVKPAMEAVAADLRKGDHNLAHGRLDKAEAAYKRVLTVDSENIKAIFSLGIAYLKGGNTEDAEGIFGKIMSLELAFGPQHTHLFNEFGIRMRKAGMLDKALAYYRKAVALNESDEHLFFNMARVHFELRDFPGAGKCLKKALEINPGFAVASKMRKSVEKLGGLSENQSS
ncbi:tetratricopeptide repeat protein [Desulfolutivibrio sulfoxidireducens]|uniref:tetratricopeptide repeat protein n=1 Tax=Desulfolutivibrio sulfoxidireducens TaxID=2773299 RepID=UPI00159E77F0|nr:tetratricopeptide repeat protein [Desulfolutivibrio sulfoxidireducens]QLA15332.1 tetratricopeptide repeat protein [Desulfolutivibrio sulfoxidireducens]QLA18910.1 tetratricopeptide repeat protein [Desulfolutivibrio sulfoxidireducens]